ncbi:MAG: class I SAM-dependent methyltransferase [Nitrosopumilus sp.]|nr:class I SAM-dependent methyltransferase [Nitrosopumilus sp.]MDH3825050.1 class I SAM-dependent methyltransferase [Nitrosopumilus sp.]
MVTINPLDVLLWTLRRNEKDVINLYDSLSPVMQVATGGSMLNFGYWTEKIKEPILAQKNLCDFFGRFAELENAHTAIDVGSGLSAPAIFWRNLYEKLNLNCVNINYKQLCFSGHEKNIEFINSTSTKLPFADNSVDRVLALESSQHFKPLDGFISESKRILKKSGILALALPVTLSHASIRKLGILKFTWSSEHYDVDFIKKLVVSKGFTITEQQLIGDHVYAPLSDYYTKNREFLKKSIQQKYPDFVEKILFKSMLKMKKAAEEKMIDYLILKCKF